MRNDRLLKDADNATLEKAAAENHRQLFSVNSACLGGKVYREENIEWTYIDGNQASAVLFPSLTKENAAEQLDLLMANYRAQPPESAGYWSLLPASPDNTGLLLLARGWQSGWQPCWMAMDTMIKPVEYSSPPEIRIITDNGMNITGIRDMPYADNGLYMSSALLHQHPERAQRFVAMMNNEVIGHCVLFFSGGESGVAGMYCVGVLPSQRRKGIGKALVLAACAFAKEKGYRYVILNANHLGKPVYEKAGFELISYGITWWLMGKRYITHAPTDTQIRLAEAIGSGDIAALNDLSVSFDRASLNTPMSNGMRWMELAVLYKQHGSAEWLIRREADCTALDAWGLGWKERVVDMLKNDPAEVNRRYFEWGATLLHIAAEKNDTDLLKTALAASPDLSIRDLHHQATALDWAYFFQRPDQIALLTAFKS